MNFEIKLAWRYLRARRAKLSRFTALVAVVGIAAGVAAMILAQSLASGFSDEMQNKILANTAHISILSNDGAEIYNWREIETTLGKIENVRDISATSYESAFINANQTTNYAVLRTIENLPVENQNTQRIEISIGKQLAEKAALKVGDEAEIISVENESLPKTSKVFVREIFQTGLYEYDASWIRISPENFVRLKGRKNFTPTILSVSVKDIYQADETAAQIRQSLSDNFKIVDWQEANQPLFAALSLERQVTLAIISLIIFIAALNITTTLALLVNERRLDIAVLRTCGATTKNLILIFLLEGLFLGFAGIFFGIALGLLGCFAGNHFRLINISAEVYSLNYIPFHPNLPMVLLIIFIALSLCLAATVYPAWRASRIKPLENLRAQ